MGARVVVHGRSEELGLSNLLPEVIRITQRGCFHAFFEAKLFVEVELAAPSVSDVLSRTVEVVGVSQIELIEEHSLPELGQRKEESISEYARRVDAFKTLAVEKFSDEHWASNCLLGLNDECLREVVKDHTQITLIVQELERQDCLERQFNMLWAKMHRVRRRHAEPQAEEVMMPTNKETLALPKVAEIFRH